MIRQITIPTKFMCKNPETWIRIEIAKINRKIGFCGFEETLKYEKQLAVLNSYL
jgi:hypothetical protein